jgi:hypothetical protein
MAKWLRPMNAAHPERKRATEEIYGLIERVTSTTKRADFVSSG